MGQLTKTQSKPFFGVTGGWLTFWLTFACSTDMMLFGYDQAVFSGVIVTQNFLELHDLVDPSRTKVLATVTAIYDIGCFLGALIAFTVGERLGRKNTVILGTTVMSVGAILQCSSFSLAQMFVGRIVLGIGNGVNTSTAPIWQTETSPPKWRGKLVMLEMMMNIVGFSIWNWINYGLSFVGGSIAWRLPLALQFIFIAALYATVPFLPESPRWLLQHDREEEATIVLAAIEAKPIDDPFIIAQKREIQFSVQYERDHSIRWRDLITQKGGDSIKPLRRLLLGAGTQLMQQIQGINILSYYLPTVLISAVGLSNQLARLLTAINSVTYLILSSFSVPLVEKWGRRGLMLLSTFGQGLAFGIIAILLRYSTDGYNNSTIAKASIPFFFIYYIAFGLGMLGIPWLYPTEINSLPMRTKGAAVATATNWLSNFVIVEITPIGIENLGGWKFFIVFTIFNAACLPIIYFLYPETANRSLEDIDEYYRSNPPLLVTGDKDVTSSKRPLKYVERENEMIQQVARDRDEENGSVIDEKTYAEKRRESVVHVERRLSKGGE